MRSMSASRGTVPLARTSRSKGVEPSKTALARMGSRLTSRLLVSETRFSESMYALMIGRNSVGRYRA